MTTIYPKPYKKDNTWYFRYTDSSGFRKKKSTRTASKTRAQQFIREFVDLMNSTVDPNTTLKDLIVPYEVPETNPKYNDAKISEAHYSERYAKKIAREARALIDALESAPGLLGRPAYQISRRMVKDIAPIVVAKYGQTAKARAVYKLLKLILKQAADDGLIQVSPAQGLPDIKAVKTKEIHALPPEDIILALSNPEVFPSDLAKDLFIVLASTGLRRSEMLALIPSQIQGNALTVDRAYKDDSCTVVGSPKWGKVRVLYLPKIAKEALERIFSDRMAIGISTRTLRLWMAAIGEHVANLNGVQMPDAWKTITPHALRHSLNSLLLVAGMSPVLVAEYMSWEHQLMMQDQSASVQKRYTHLYAKNLKPVADKIDEIFGGVEGRAEKVE
jgi:integrase